jgi:FtsP/CotA-like multicopper oxidase with cupredoxin domain
VVDYTQELGMYGNIIVVPTEPEYWAPVNRELVLVLDDILLTGDQAAPFSKAESNRTAMGRYGNVMLVNGQTEYCMQVRRGEVVRLYLTNTANVRPFNFRIPGARMKLVGGDGGRIECEAFVSEVLIAPSERVIVDVLFAEPGQLRMEHAGPEQSYMLGSVTAHDWPVEQSYTRQFSNLRTSPEFAPERAGLQGNWSVHPTRPSGLSRSCRA